MMIEGSASASAPACDGVRIVSRRMVRPSSPTSRDGDTTKPKTTETVHLTPWDLQMLTVDYIQMGVSLPSWPTTATAEHWVGHLARSLARALERFYPFAGRLAVDEHSGSGGEEGAVTVSLLCNGDGADFVHAVADHATVADVVMAGSTRVIPRVLWSFFPLNGLVGADAAAVAGGSLSRPVLAAQVTELADGGGVFVALSLNHGVADGTAFWHLFNTWSEISRGGDGTTKTSTALPVLERWFPDTCPVPVLLPFATLDHAVRRFHGPPVEECFLAFSAETVRSLKARANAEVTGAAQHAGGGGGNNNSAEVSISSLQSLLAHVWLAVTHARCLPPEQETTYTLAVSCRGRVRGVADAYAGNAMVRTTARAAAGVLLRGGLGRAARLLNRAVATARDEAGPAVAAWHEHPTRFAYLDGWWHPALMVTGNSPRFDAFGNDFGWGRPLVVRSGAGNKVDGRATVYEGRGAGGVGMELCLAPEAMARLVADHDFMAAVSC